MNRRLEEVLQSMRALGLDCVAILNDGSLRNYGYYTYFTGVYEPRRAMLTIQRHGALRTWIECPSTSDTKDLVKYPRGIEVTPVANVTDLVGCTEDWTWCGNPQNVGFVGCDAIERFGINPSAHGFLSGCTDHAELKERILRIKRRKSADDLRHSRYGYTLATQGMSMYVALARELGPSLSAQAHVTEWLESQGAEPSIVQVGDEITGTSNGHRSSVAFVLVELAVPSGHWVEVGRTILLSHATTEQRAKVERLQTAFQGMVRTMVPGMACRQLALNAERIAGDLGASIEGRIGHGTGIDEDLPSIHKDSVDQIESGDIFCLHLILRDEIEGFLYGVADTFWMTRDGAVPLAKVSGAQVLI